MTRTIRCLIWTFVTTALATVSAQDPVDFAHQVAPLLQARCGECHLDGNRQGSLSFNTRNEMLQAEIVDLAEPGESEILYRIGNPDADLRMPPEGEPLTEQEVATISRWIEQGLVWDDGFTFNRDRSDRPLSLRPIAVDDRQDRHPIDQILDRYRTELALPAAESVDDRTFYRRASLDLVGLLPTAGQLQSFVDETAADNRRQLIDRLLADEASYADHWLTFWNDLLRNDYTGTGYIDGGRLAITSWLYDALRENLPYDQLVRELLQPGEATAGFAHGIRWRGRVNASQVPELQFAQNVGQVFLGVNLKCASCHDSFIDDWKLTDAYGLAAIVAERPLELHRCDVPLGAMATPSFLFPELGQIDPLSDRSTRLAALAQLVTGEANGRFARTIVNRLWDRMVGYPLVHPVDTMAAPAWNEDLLDYLAADLVAHGFDLKQTLRQIATSQAYQQPSVAPPAAGDPFVFRGPLARRLTAEQWLDAVWQLTDQFPDKAAAGIADRGDRPVRASLIPSTPLMRSLGRPNREQVVTTRPAEWTMLEALDLANGEELAGILRGGGEQLSGRADQSTAAEQVDWLYLHALARQPTSAERQIALQFLAADDSSPAAWSDLLWAVIVTPEFNFVR